MSNASAKIDQVMLNLKRDSKIAVAWFKRADWQHKFLVTGLSPDYNMVTVRV